MKRVLTIISITFFFNSLNAQENCKVVVDALKGTYTGGCKDGKAEGKGTATGTDSYEGDFVKGYPDGLGKYIWKDGHYYLGAFKKGKLEGAGKMYFEAANGQDSIIAGYWKKDKYAGKYENAWVLKIKTTRINKVDARLERKTDKGIINITSTQQSNAGNMAIAEITNITVLTGQFINKNNSKLTNSSILRVQQIIFPFSAIFTYSNGESFQITFFEPGDYDVTVSLQ